MSYHQKSLGLPDDAESTPDTARWYKLSSSVSSFLSSAYPTDRGLRDLLANSGLVFVGISPDGMYYMTSQSTGLLGGSYRDPIGAPILTYDQVLQAFAASPSGGPTTKAFPVTPAAPAAPAHAPASGSKLPLYIGIGLGVLAVVSGGVFAVKRYKQKTS